MHRIRVVISLAVVLLLAGIAGADVVTDWNSCTLEMVKTTDMHPPLASRALAMVHIAIYDSVNAIDKGHEPYYVDIDVQGDVSPEAAAASAAYEILSYIFPGYISVFDIKLAESLSQVPDGEPKELGIILGRQVAEEIIELRSDDGWDSVVPYDPEPVPGIWRPTPPQYSPPAVPNWALVTPFAMQSQSELRPGPPPALRSQEYAAAVNEVAALGCDCSQVRTADQTEIAFFWADDFNSVSPPGRWSIVAQEVAAQYGNTLSENSRLFALLNIALADAAICAWDCKYAYSLWRPITAVNEADTDANRLTTADPEWNSLLTTPSFPEYPSGHSTFGAAAAEIIARFFGTDRIEFTLESTSPHAGRRTFNSLSSAARENGISRIYGGVHYSFGNTQGLKLGRKIADYVWEHYLR